MRRETLMKHINDPKFTMADVAEALDMSRTGAINAMMNEACLYIKEHVDNGDTEKK